MAVLWCWIGIYGRSYRSRIADQVARVFAVPDRPLRVVAGEAWEGVPMP